LNKTVTGNDHFWQVKAMVRDKEGTEIKKNQKKQPS